MLEDLYENNSYKEDADAMLLSPLHMVVVLLCSLKSSAKAPLVKSRTGLLRRGSSFRFRLTSCDAVYTCYVLVRII